MSQLNDSKIPMILKKVEESEKFIFLGTIWPQGEYVLMPSIKEEVVGEISIDLILKPEQVSTSSNTYQEVAKWIVSKNKGYLDALCFYSDTPAIAQWELKIKGDTIFTNKKIQTALSVDIPDIDLKEGDVIIINVKSDGATTIVGDGLIQGREVG